MAMELIMWNAPELKCPSRGIFSGRINKSVGFVPVFTDIDELKASCPGAEIIEVTVKDSD